MSFFWPTKVAAETTALVRTGRVLHWTGLLLAAPWVIMGVWFWLIGDSPNVLSLVLVGIPFALLGRGLRYILAGE